LNSRIPLVRTSSKSAARRRPRRGAARNRGPGADPAGGTGAPDRRAAARPGARGAGPDGRARRRGAGPGGADPPRPRPRDRTRARDAGSPATPGGRRARRGAPAPPPGSPGAAATPAAAGAIHGKGPARVQSRRRRRPPPVPGRSPRGGTRPRRRGPPAPPPPAPPAPPPPRGPPPLRPGGGERGREGGERRAGGGGGRAGRGWGGGGPAGGGPGRGEGGGASSSRGARPAPLRAPARPTQPLEPILIPKLRIRLADFPYLHCSNMPEAVHLGDLLRIWVRPGARFTPSPPDFQGPARAHRTPPEPRRFPRHGPLSRGEPIPGRPALHKEKRTLPGAPAGFSGIGRVTALDASRRPSPPLRIRGSEPDSLSIG
uniref:Uncharacterized protein n=1 Tax=Equus asinus TaxID=9793 RepID=A0A9L0JXT7_EQUAS